MRWPTTSKALQVSPPSFDLTHASGSGRSQASTRNGVRASTAIASARSNRIGTRFSTGGPYVECTRLHHRSVSLVDLALDFEHLYSPRRATGSAITAELTSASRKSHSGTPPAPVQYRHGESRHWSSHHG